LSARHVAATIAFAGGLGLVPKVPGVAASIAGLVLAVVLDGLGGRALIIVAGLGLVAAGVWACEVVLKAAAAGAMAVERHQLAIRDLAGQVLAVAAAPMSPAGLLIAFGAYQIFALSRPWPIDTLGLSLPRGVMAMADGVLAAVAAGLIIGMMTWILRPA